MSLITVAAVASLLSAADDVGTDEQLERIREATLILGWEAEKQRASEEVLRHRQDPVFADDEELVAAIAKRKAEFARENGLSEQEFDAMLARFMERRLQRIEAGKNERFRNSFWYAGLFVLNIPLLLFYGWLYYGNWDNYLEELSERRSAPRRWRRQRELVFWTPCILVFMIECWQLSEFLKSH